MRSIIGVVAAAAAMACLPFAESSGGEAVVPGLGTTFHVPVDSVKERQSMTVVRQQYDFSCGAASVATLLSYHYGRATGEREVFEAMFEAGDQETIREQGFSMLDMKRYLDGLGFHADGFRLKLERVEEIGVPVITLINLNGYKHFVVLKGIAADRVLVGDPAFGTTAMKRDRFQSIWSGTILAIRDEPYEAREQFNRKAEWGIRPQAPIGTTPGRDATVSNFLLTVPGPRVFSGTTGLPAGISGATTGTF